MHLDHTDSSYQTHGKVKVILYVTRWHEEGE